jgi:hypothetical protein
LFCRNGTFRGVLEGPTDPVLLNGMKALTFKSCWNVEGLGDADTKAKLGVTSLAVLFEAITGHDWANVELLPQP